MRDEDECARAQRDVLCDMKACRKICPSGEGRLLSLSNPRCYREEQERWRKTGTGCMYWSCSEMGAHGSTEYHGTEARLSMVRRCHPYVLIRAFVTSTISSRTD